MAVFYWIRKLIHEMRRASGPSWVHIYNEDGSITSMKVA